MSDSNAWQDADIANLRDMTYDRLEELAGSLRTRIRETVERNGGHLASNLGVVELTIALHRVYDSPRDKLIFDVGHQCYAHKLLTGRADRFGTIRTQGGLSGYPVREESEHDAFGAGHASTAVSAALGFARARDILDEAYDVAVVVGDGALTGGETYEALNDAGQTQTPMVVILNDNGMSISRNVGALTRTLTHARSAPAYWGFKRALTRLLNRLPGGDGLYRAFQNIKNGVKYLFVHGKFFDALGFVYLGLVDGHDIAELEYTLRRARAINKPVIVHVSTVKGKGDAEAEAEPSAYHGVNAPPQAMADEPEHPCAEVVGQALCELARVDPRIVAVTAAMPISTGLSDFSGEFPTRFFDAGIAEEHAATLCAGFAAAGMRPYFAVYSTFLQRAYDQMIHDVALQGLPVTFLVDRAGLCGSDGLTHQGIYDIAMAIPFARTGKGVTLLAPRSLQELDAMIRWSSIAAEPVVIRYPRALSDGHMVSFVPGNWLVSREGESPIAIIALGPMVYQAIRAASLMENIDPWIIAANSIYPLDDDCLRALHGMKVLTIEEGVVTGGFGSLVRQRMEEIGVYDVKVRSIGVPPIPVYHAEVEAQRAQCGLTPTAIARTAEDWLADG